MGNATSKLFNEQIQQLDNEYNKLLIAEKNELRSRYNNSNHFLDCYDFSDWFVLSLEGDEKVPPMPIPEGDEEKLKEGKALNFLARNKLLRRPQLLFSYISVGRKTNSN